MNTEIIVTLESGADSNLISHVIENIKGVLKTSIQKEQNNEKDRRHEEWMHRIKELSHGLDSSIVDMSDERTRYIMSK